jgi:C-terminal processing protease CtpA/Prc
VTFEQKKTREGYVVQRLLKRGQKDRFPIAPGSVLSEVDYRSVADKSPEELTKLLSGPKGSKVELGLKSEGKITYVTTTRDFDAQRLLVVTTTKNR